MLKLNSSCRWRVANVAAICSARLSKVFSKKRHVICLGGKKKNVKKPYVPTYANCGCIVIVTVFYFSVNRENFFNLSVSCSAIISRMMNGTGKQWRSKQVVGMALAKGRESRGRQSRGRESRGAGAGVPEQGAPS